MKSSVCVVAVYVVERPSLLGSLVEASLIERAIGDAVAGIVSERGKIWLSDRVEVESASRRSNGFDESVIW